eukprot:GHVU01103024.1.p1 GENE.GHVU01103024.1~~GHVU01103024.1.p1  ORF type:complete len:360 (+),score=39.78 GHVU01103024.1:33-1112(+)
MKTGQPRSGYRFLNHCPAIFQDFGFPKPSGTACLMVACFLPGTAALRCWLLVFFFVIIILAAVPYYQHSYSMVPIRCQFGPRVPIRSDSACVLPRGVPRCTHRVRSCGRFTTLANCSGNHGELARQYLGDECYDLKLKYFMDAKNSDYKAGPGITWCSIANSLIAGGKDMKDFFFPHEKSEDMDYNVAFVPGWMHEAKYNAWRQNNSLVPHTRTKKCLVVLGPNFDPPKLKPESDLWMPGCRRMTVSASAWGVTAALKKFHQPNATLERGPNDPTLWAYASLPQSFDSEEVDRRKICPEKPATIDPPSLRGGEVKKSGKRKLRCVLYYKNANNRDVGLQRPSPSSIFIYCHLSVSSECV